MSSGKRYSAEDVHRTSQRAIAALLECGAESVVIGGSLRRDLSTAADIEAICVSRMERVPASDDPYQTDLFGERQRATVERPALLAGIDAWVERSDLSRHAEPPLVEGRHVSIEEATPRLWGTKYRKAVITDWTEGLRIPLDIFIAEHAGAGWVLVLRTGSAAFNIWLLHRAKVHGFVAEKGRLWKGGKAVPTPTESDAFRALGMIAIPPASRSMRDGETDADAARRWTAEGAGKG